MVAVVKQQFVQSKSLDERRIRALAIDLMNLLIPERFHKFYCFGMKNSKRHIEMPLFFELMMED